MARIGAIPLFCHGFRNKPTVRQSLCLFDKKKVQDEAHFALSTIPGKPETNLFPGRTLISGPIFFHGRAEGIDSAYNRDRHKVRSLRESWTKLEEVNQRHFPRQWKVGQDVLFERHVLIARRGRYVLAI